MGQAQSGAAHNATAEELSLQLAEKFVHKCFSGVELYSFKDNFRSLADRTTTTSSSNNNNNNNNNNSGFLYWSEDTLIRFLSIPDCLGVGGVLFQSVSYMGAFPFPSLAPAILNFEALVKVVAVYTGRYRKVLKRQQDPLKLLFRSLAVYERQVEGEAGKGEGAGEKTEEGKEKKMEGEEGGAAADTEFEYWEEDDDDDDLSLAALDALDAIEVFAHAERPDINHARIPLENLRKLIAFLLVVAPVGPNEPIAAFADRFATPEALAELMETAECVLRAFKSRDGKGVLFKDFKVAVKKSMQYLFDPLEPLFMHFLFSKKVDMTHPTTPLSTPLTPTPLLPSPGKILTTNLLTQLSLVLPSSRLYRRLRPLYAGSTNGFSMGSFETHVVNWAAPTLLLVSGTLTSAHKRRTFTDSLPPRRYPAGGEEGERVVYGVYLNTPWRVSHRDCFGDAHSFLFQLSPTHRVFDASTASTEYAFFNRDSGIGFGSPVLKSKSHHSHGPQRTPYLDLGPVSLTFDPSLEFGVFQHVGRGGAFHMAGEEEWQDVFEVVEMEVWGLGGDDEAEAQKKAWAWEEREALARRGVKTGDVETDRALLEMAGLIGQGRSGGSV